jgi:hypothetical protein
LKVVRRWQTEGGGRDGLEGVHVKQGRSARGVRMGREEDDREVVPGQ